MANRVYIESRHAPEGVWCKAWDDYDESPEFLVASGHGKEGTFDLIARALEADPTFCDMMWAALENDTATELDGNHFDTTGFFSFLETQELKTAMDKSLPAPTPRPPKTRI